MNIELWFDLHSISFLCFDWVVLRGVAVLIVSSIGTTKGKVMKIGTSISVFFKCQSLQCVCCGGGFSSGCRAKTALTYILIIEKGRWPDYHQNSLRETKKNTISSCFYSSEKMRSQNHRSQKNTAPPVIDPLWRLQWLIVRLPVFVKPPSLITCTALLSLQKTPCEIPGSQSELPERGMLSFCQFFSLLLWCLMSSHLMTQVRFFWMKLGCICHE